jgi:hypothetical protein
LGGEAPAELLNIGSPGGLPSRCWPNAKRELILFLLMYLFIRQPESGKAPIESIIPDAREMPLYKMINDPLRTVMGVENVKRNVKMADSELLQCA